MQYSFFVSTLSTEVMAKYRRYQVDIRFHWFEKTFTNTVFISSDRSVREIGTILRDHINRKYAGYGWCSPVEREHDGLDPVPAVVVSNDGRGCSVDWGTYNSCKAYHKRFVVNEYVPPQFPIMDESFRLCVA